MKLYCTERKICVEHLDRFWASRNFISKFPIVAALLDPPVVDFRPPNPRILLKQFELRDAVYGKM